MSDQNVNTAVELERIKTEANMLFKEKNMIIAYALWWFLGLFGAHRFYNGRTGSGIAMLLISFVGIFTLIPLFITGIWWLVDAFLVHGWVNTYNDEQSVKRIAFLESKTKPATPTPAPAEAPAEAPASA